MSTVVFLIHLLPLLAVLAILGASVALLVGTLREMFGGES